MVDANGYITFFKKGMRKNNKKWYMKNGQVDGEKRSEQTGHDKKRIRKIWHRLMSVWMSCA